MKLTRIGAAAVGVGLAVSATVVGVATPALASANCTTWISHDQGTGYAKCTGGGTRFDTHRVKVVCMNSAGHTHNVNGPWVNTRDGETSKAVCSTDPGHTGIEVYRISVETDPFD
ncbi:hypothetical protein ACFY0F_11295 [Streptomyces sp. NPDC001544]|uniref:hypothetical protein n=1 Tax=Streptomyces sp. NPDC001544 TaxID=3364584 RepID=UPI0036C922B9